MQLSKVIERVKGHVRDGGVRSALAQLAEELRTKVLPIVVRSATEAASRSGRGGAGGEGGQPNYVFNISVAVAVGVPVNKAAGTPGEEDSPEAGDVHGEGAPAIATANVGAVPDRAAPKATVKAETPRKARAAGNKRAGVKTKSTRRPRASPTAR